ncbi:PilZ domain-containing protein [Altererythrobacter sp. BO-6]|uniref:PilZ domain-containing protein n=1 Tax=Altererythrobacter sp. BO-6 TaxID=2604537 RepID=UPI0013E1475E|nr:PilZ domain-containing protein [Altererythrobacter sp. BO-6]QIG54123.1 PilZ domain-containing protein [Altererythrobacter sp. BO-6]
MDSAAFMPIGEPDTVATPDLRRAHRYSLLIRPAKLVCSEGEFVCVLRDVSANGVSARLFHRLPAVREFTLELQDGQAYQVERVWERDREAGFKFTGEIDLPRLIGEMGAHRKRGLRLSLNFPITVTTGTMRTMATVENISQQGARFECDERLAIDQSLRIEGRRLRETRAKVRWRRGNHYGVVFDDTFSLADFALVMVRLQAPNLLV